MQETATLQRDRVMTDKDSDFDPAISNSANLLRY